MALIQNRQNKYFSKKLSASLSNENIPIIKSFNLIKENSTKGYISLINNLNVDYDIIEKDREDIKNSIVNANNNQTKIQTYNTLNRDCKIHNIYYDKEVFPEHMRLEFTRFRLSSHNLEVESGRWKRIPHINRTCKCDGNAIQDELHVLKDCSLTDHIRSTYNIEVTNLNDFFELENYVTLNMIYEISKYFK